MTKRWKSAVLFLIVILLAGGCKSSPQKTIIGVWRDTSESSNPEFLGTKVEFVDDGTLILTKTWKSSHEVYVGDYQMIDGNRIRVSMSSLPPIILNIDSLDSKILLITSDQDLGEYLCCGSDFIYGFSYRYEREN